MKQSEQEFDEFMEKFKKEEPVLVKKALEACMKLYGRSCWNCMYSGKQVDAVWCWIDGWNSARD